MIAESHASEIPPWQKRFLRLLPSIQCHAEIRFRNIGPELREEMVQETIARALVDYRRLMDRHMEHAASASPLARFAVAQVRHGRRVGSRLNVHDVSSEYCRTRKGVSLKSLDRCDLESGAWQEVLVEDRHTTPADIASIRIDVGLWLETLPNRSRHMAERLASGETTLAVARLFGISCGRVSQMRRELQHDWYSFQGELVPHSQKITR